MKKLLLLSTFTFFLLPLSFCQSYGWTDISANIPGNPDLSDVFFVSDNEGWMSVSNEAIILHTTDGGESFEIQTTQYPTEAIYMIDEHEGYSGGANGRVYRTTDGGENWIAIGSISVTLTDIDFATTTQGYCCGDHGAVFSITPQGVTNLNSGQPTFFSGISSPSLDNVWICGGNDVMYYDGIAFDFQSGPGGTYNDVFFLNEHEGWIVGNNGVIGQTINGGNSWPSQTNPDPNSLYGVFFLNENIGWAIGAQGTILKTTNSGDTWALDEEGSTLAGTKFLRGVHFTSPNNGYIVGNDKTLLKYGEITGIGEENEALKLDIFPNPAKDKIQIECSEFKNESGMIEILSLEGKMIMEKEIEIGIENIELDLNNLKSGVYLCKITIDNRSSTKKIIKE